MAHARTDAGPAITGAIATRQKATSDSRKRLLVIMIIGVSSVLGAVVVSMHHGFEVGPLIVKPASGDSMSPWSHDGDTLVVWRHFTLIPNQSYLFCVSGDLQCKKLSKVEGEVLHLESINPEGSRTTYFTARRNEVVGQVKLVIPTHLLWRNDDSKQPAPEKVRRVTAEEKLEAYRNALEAEHKAMKLLNEQYTQAIPCFDHTQACDGNLKTSVALSRGKSLDVKPQSQFKHLALWAQSDDNIWVNGHDTGPYSGSWCHKVLDTKGDKVTIEVRQASGKMAPPGAIINEIVFFP